MSRSLTIFVILSALATGAAITLGLAAEDVEASQFWPNFSRAVAVVSWIVGALIWCTERICGEIRALGEDAAKNQRRTRKRMRRLETLAHERIEAAHQVVDLFDKQRRTGNR